MILDTLLTLCAIGFMVWLIACSSNGDGFGDGPPDAHV